MLAATASVLLTSRLGSYGRKGSSRSPCARHRSGSSSPSSGTPAHCRLDFGSMVLAAGTAGEFGPIVLMSLLISETSRGVHVMLLIAFTAIAIGSAVIAVRYHPPAAIRMLGRGMHATSQLPVRVSLLLLVGLAYLAQQFGLDLILGAFASGLVVSLATKGRPGQPLREKLDGIGYGFLVPIFFVTSGIHYDLTALLASTESLLRLPVFLALFLLVRGLPALLYRNDLPRRELAPLALLSATGLPLIVAIASIGVSIGRMRTDNAAALVGAAMISVFLFPLAALWLRKWTRRRHSGAER